MPYLVCCWSSITGRQPFLSSLLYQPARCLCLLLLLLLVLQVLLQADVPAGCCVGAAAGCLWEMVAAAAVGLLAAASAA